MLLLSCATMFLCGRPLRPFVYLLWMCMSKMTNKGCARHLMISGGVMVLLAVVMVVLNWNTFALMFSNMTALGEGASTAEQMATPDALLEYMAAHPERASLVVMDVGAGEPSIQFQADAERPLVNAPRLVLLAAYAEAVTEGRVNPDTLVSLSAVQRYHLEARGQGGHPSAVERLREEGAITNDSLALHTLVRSIMQYNDEAAADWLLVALGYETVDATRERLGWPARATPLPSSGRTLSWRHPQMDSTPAERLTQLTARPQHAYAQEVMDLTASFVAPGSFRNDVLAVVRERGTEISLRHQRALAHATYPTGSADAYATVLARALTDAFHTPEASAHFRAALERQVAADTLEGVLPVEVIGSVSGAFPGLLSFAAYARRPDPLPDRIVVSFIQDLPIAIFYHLMQTGMDRALFIRLLSDDAYVEEAARFLSDHAVDEDIAAR